MEEKKKRSKWSTGFVKFAVMLSVSVVAIEGMFLCGKCTLLAEEQAVELTLNKRNDVDNAAFHVSNMFPGDMVEGKYCVKISYEDAVAVRFRVDIGEGYEKLAEVLKCKIELLGTGEVLYDGLMKDVPDPLEHGLPYAEKGEEELLYQINAYLDTSVGNEYQNTDLVADFVWWIEEEENTDDGKDQTPADITIPGTGDDTNMMMWLALAVCVAAAFIVLIIIKKRKEGRYNER